MPLQPKLGLYATPEEALKKVSSEFEYWTGKLTETSLQMCYALIGANWVIFGSVNGILHSQWAKWSLVLVMLALSSNVIGAWILSESLRTRIGYGEGHTAEWAVQFEANRGKDVFVAVHRQDSEHGQIHALDKGGVHHREPSSAHHRRNPEIATRYS